MDDTQKGNDYWNTKALLYYGIPLSAMGQMEFHKAYLELENIACDPSILAHLSEIMDLYPTLGSYYLKHGTKYPATQLREDIVALVVGNQMSPTLAFLGTLSVEIFKAFHLKDEFLVVNDAFLEAIRDGGLEHPLVQHLIEIQHDWGYLAYSTIMAVGTQYPELYELCK